MGYRSDVRMVITGPKERMLAEFAALRLSNDDAMRKALDEFVVAEVKEGQAVAVLGHGGVSWKWCEEYSDVRALIKVWEHFEGLQDSFEGSFVRIGEATDDIVHIAFGSNGYDLAYPTRTIECDFDNAILEDIRPRLKPRA